MMIRFILSCTFILLLNCIQSSDASDFSKKNASVSLNDEGVKALKDKKWHKAFRKFKKAIEIDKSNKVAKQNLGYAHNNFALYLCIEERKHKEALEHFHQAFYLDPENQTTVANMNGVIKLLNKNPTQFKDRKELGDQAYNKGDFIGAIVEYEAALKINDNKQLRTKLKRIRELQDRSD